MKTMKRILTISLFLIFAVSMASAQNEATRPIQPGAVQTRMEKLREYVGQEKQMKEKKEAEEKGPVVPKKDVPAEVKKDVPGQVIYVKKITTDSSAILSEEDIRTITKPVEGTEATFDDLLNVIRKINELYRNRHFITARAFLAPQKIVDGVVVIRLIEGRIGRIIIENNKSTKESFFLNRIALKSGDIVDLQVLEKDLNLINNVYDVNARAELRAGDEPGTTDCIIKVAEPKQFELSAFTDNAGRDDIGLYRVGIMGVDNSLFGIRDRLSIGSYWSEGTVSASVSYDLPINRFGTRLGGSYDLNQIDVISGPFESLKIAGDSSDIGAFITHPVVAKQAFKLTGFLGYHAKKSITEFDNVPLFDTRVHSVNYGTEIQITEKKGFWYNRNTLTNGIKSFGGDINFFRFNMDISRTQILPKDLIGIVRVSGQYSNKDLLPSSEQFQIGGQSSVRGYSEGLLIGDQGYIVSAELDFPIFNKSSNWRDRIKGAVYVDHGGAFPFKPAGESITEDDFLTSTGFGVILNFTKRLTGRLNLAFPLSDQKGDKGDPQFHFYLQSYAF